MTITPGSRPAFTNAFPRTFTHGFPYDVDSSASGSAVAMRRTSSQSAMGAG
ncbi:MAG TPA: hypothetical protein VIJ70_06735 [Gaiellaceae bacterium]